ncbi:hypothetical protein Q3A66_07580 [Hymenobacter sp. BT770]|uniref:hypothetical protein n=1 Tax=Hymenobacter sp. BT770 TaxID=2886942 RepID=UPI001D12FCF3|nr:hypothetical protein [Hymenobacter sp. BT770]MCC3152851.1 hypothetical protein [Hymenobacter sp. BT770]MDO3414926.1 hypothetical protein [Hymenobacter sp. BT770]
MKLRYFFLLLSYSVLASLPAARAQKRPDAPTPPDAPTQTARTELPLTAFESEVHVQALPADSTVVLLVGRNKGLSNKSTFGFQQFDKDLHLRHELALDMPQEFGFTRMCAEGNTVYALFTSTSTPGRLFAAAYNGRLGQVRTQQYETRLSREIVDLKALDGRLFATVLLNDQLHVTALLLDVASGQMQYLSSIYEPLPTQLTFVADAASRRAEYVLSQTNGRKSRLLLKQLTDRGQLVSSEFVQAESERSLITAQLTPPQDTTARLLMGTYSLRDPSFAQGLFATDLRPTAGNGTKPPLRFYDFLHLKHFFDYLKPSRQARLREQTQRRVARSEPPKRWHYRLLLHELLPQPDGGYVLVAEVYYPHYRYNSYGNLPPSFYNGPQYGYGNGNARVFDGYQTTHALVCGFDRSGTLLWDNTFVVENLRRTDLEEAVRLQPLPDGRLVLAYIDEEKLRYKVINRAETSSNDHEVPLQTGSGATAAAERVSDTSQADLLPWFGTRFVASGYQRIHVDHGPDREVFFLNSVAF